jgi:group I intron endonuclease
MKIQNKHQDIIDRACLKNGDLFEGRVVGTKKVSGTYILEHQASLKYYVGSSTDLTRRQKEHIKELRSNTHHSKELQHLYNTEPCFTFITLSVTDNVKEEEQKLLDIHYAKPLCLNLAANSVAPQQDRPHTEQTKSKMIQAATGRPCSERARQLLIERNRNRIVSEESRLKMSKSHLTPEAIQRRREISKERMVPVEVQGIVFESIADAARHFNVVPRTVAVRIQSSDEKFKDWKKL